MDEWEERNNEDKERVMLTFSLYLTLVVWTIKESNSIRFIGIKEALKYTKDKLQEIRIKDTGTGGDFHDI